MPAEPKSQGCRQAPHAALTELQQQLFTEGVVSRQLLDAVPNPLLIINASWQVVYANPAVRHLVQNGSDRPVPGLSTGEAFHCAHARHQVQEAGQHDSCRICGIARALSLSLKGQSVSEDCQLACDLTGAEGQPAHRQHADQVPVHSHSVGSLSVPCDVRRPGGSTTLGVDNVVTVTSGSSFAANAEIVINRGTNCTDAEQLLAYHALAPGVNRRNAVSLFFNLCMGN